MKKIDDFIDKIICGDALEVLKEIPDESIDLVITSPPYYGLRNYQVEGQIGLEPTFEEYLEKLLKITAELKRVLKNEGQLWLNIGDCYYGGGHGGWKKFEEGFIELKDPIYKGRNTCPVIKWDYSKYNAKCLLMQPERLAIRMIDEQGWILRNKVIWAKQVLIKKENKTIGSVMPSCLSPDTEVYIKDRDGIVKPVSLKELINQNIHDLQILSPTGWKKIKNIWWVKKDKTIRFKVGSSAEIECSLDHKFPISHDNRRKRYEIKEVKDLRENPQRTLDRFLFKPIKEFIPDIKFEIEIDDFDFIRGSHNPYQKNGKKRKIPLNYETGKLVGLYVAEGGFVDRDIIKSYQGKFTFNATEKELYEFVERKLTKLFGIKCKLQKKKNYVSIVFSSKIVKDFISLWVSGKCKNKMLNMINILNTNFDFRKGLFDGIIAGDGYIDKNGRIVYASASKQLRDDVYLLASSIGLLASRYESHRKDKRTNKIYNTYWLTIPVSLQKEKECGERECERGKPLMAKYKNEFIAKTLKFSNPEIIEQEKTLIDIEVEDGLFLINGGVISHNSVKDRFNESWEYLYFFTKSKKYYSNLDAVRIPPQTFENRPYGIVREREFGYNTEYPLVRQKINLHLNKEERDAIKEEIERYKQETGKIKGGGANLNLPWDPITGGKIYKIGRHPETLRHKGIWRLDNFERKKLYQVEMEGKRKDEEFDDEYWWNFLHGTSHTNRFYKKAFQILKKWMTENKCYDYEKFYQWWLTQKEGNWSSGDLIQGQSKKLENELPFPEPKSRLLGKNIPTVWQISPEAHNFKEELGVDCDHFAVFPEALVEIPIKFGSPPNGIVLDPFCGSGTALVVAKRLGRHYIGIDLNPDYCEIAKRRLSKLPERLDSFWEVSNNEEE